MDAASAEYVQLESSIGLNCVSKNCLLIHPSETYMIFAVGSMVVVRSVNDDRDRFLRGHTALVHCLAVSSRGNLLASGEVHDQTSQDSAALIVWDFHQQ